MLWGTFGRGKKWRFNSFCGPLLCAYNKVVSHKHGMHACSADLGFVKPFFVSVFPLFRSSRELQVSVFFSQGFSTFDPNRPEGAAHRVCGRAVNRPSGEAQPCSRQHRGRRRPQLEISECVVFDYRYVQLLTVLPSAVCPVPGTCLLHESAVRSTRELPSSPRLIDVYHCFCRIPAQFTLWC